MEVDGRKIAAGITAGLKNVPRPKKYLAALLVGNDPDSASFVKIKQQTAKKLGWDFRLHHILPENLRKPLAKDFLRKEVLRLAKPKNCGGLLVQLPLPDGIDKHYVLNAIPLNKDIDVLGERAIGACYNSRFPIRQPAVETAEEIIAYLGIKLEECRAAVVGLGFLIGQPMALWLTGRTKELYLLDSRSDLKILANTDIVITGVGRAGLIRPSMLKKNAVVIDFGWDTVNGKISGDLDTTDIANFPITYTPTPGGTGPILVAKLFENFRKLNEK